MSTACELGERCHNRGPSNGDKRTPWRRYGSNPRPLDCQSVSKRLPVHPGSCEIALSSPFEGSTRAIGNRSAFGCGDFAEIFWPDSALRCPPSLAPGREEQRRLLVDNPTFTKASGVPRMRWIHEANGTEPHATSLEQAESCCAVAA